MSIEWKVIPGFSKYEVSNDGRVRRSIVSRNGFLGERKLKLTADGYLNVGIDCDNGARKHINVHQLVLAAFLGPKAKGMQCCHNNGIRTDNRIENLRYDTPTGNASDKWIHGTMTRGSAVNKSKLTESQVIDIYQRAVAGEAYAEIAKDYRVSDGTVSHIAMRRSWRHLALPKHKYVARFSDADILRLFDVFYKTLSFQKAAKEFGVTRSTAFTALSSRLHKLSPDRARLFDSRRRLRKAEAA